MVRGQLKAEMVHLLQLHGKYSSGWAGSEPDGPKNKQKEKTYLAITGITQNEIKTDILFHLFYLAFETFNNI